MMEEEKAQFAVCKNNFLIYQISVHTLNYLTFSKLSFSINYVIEHVLHLRDKFHDISFFINKIIFLYTQFFIFLIIGT